MSSVLTNYLSTSEETSGDLDQYTPGNQNVAPENPSEKVVTEGFVESRYYSLRPKESIFRWNPTDPTLPQRANPKLPSKSLRWGGDGPEPQTILEEPAPAPQDLIESEEEERRSDDSEDWRVPHEEEESEAGGGCEGRVVVPEPLDPPHRG